MKTDTRIPLPLPETLQNLISNPVGFEESAIQLFLYEYEDYNRIFELDVMQVERGKYTRIPVYNSEECVAVLMIWGADTETAIHDHRHYDGKIKVLKGMLSEVSYRENDNFIEFCNVNSAVNGMQLTEEIGGIHSIINNSEGLSVSLHIYRTELINLDGVRIFDTQERKIGWLNETAPICSWHLPETAYSKILKI